MFQPSPGIAYATTAHDETLDIELNACSYAPAPQPPRVFVDSSQLPGLLRAKLLQRLNGTDVKDVLRGKGWLFFRQIVQELFDFCLCPPRHFFRRQGRPQSRLNKRSACVPTVR